RCDIALPRRCKKPCTRTHLNCASYSGLRREQHCCARPSSAGCSQKRRTPDMSLKWHVALVSALLASSAPSFAAGPLPIEEIVVRYQLAVSALELTGTVEAADVVPLSFKSAGRIVIIDVDVGDEVSL